MNDLVSRQGAINAIKTWGLIDGLSEGEAIEILSDEEKLPSAQFEIIRCKDCKYYMGNWYCEAWNNSPGFPAVSEDMFCCLAERRKMIPTEKQIKYAKYLAERMCVELPEEFTKEAYSKFIDRWKPIVKHEDDGMNDPNEWQWRYS